MISIPSIEEVIQKGIALHVVAENESWYKQYLGEYAEKSGVYIHHCHGKILYVGQTSKTGGWGTFHVRLRRECQPKAASNSSLYQLLFQHAKEVKTSLYHFDEVVSMFSGSVLKKLTPERMILILEQLMIAVYKPIGNKK